MKIFQLHFTTWILRKIENFPNILIFLTKSNRKYMKSEIKKLACLWAHIYWSSADRILDFKSIQLCRACRKILRVLRNKENRKPLQKLLKKVKSFYN